MLKLLSAIVLSSVLSVSAMLGLVHLTPKAVEDFRPIQEASRKVVGETVGPFGEMMTASCSAVSIAPDIHLTAAHCDFANLTVDGAKATVLKKDVEGDLMLVHADTSDSFVPVSKRAAQVGDRVVANGFPFGEFIGFVPVLTEGVVSGLVKGKAEYGTKRFNRWLVMNLIIDGGNSGGGIFSKVDGKWVVVSVVSMGTKHLSLSPNTHMLHGFLERK